MNDFFRRRRHNRLVIPGIVLVLVVVAALVWQYGLPHSSAHSPGADLNSAVSAQVLPEATHAAATVPATAEAPAPMPAPAPPSPPPPAPRVTAAPPAVAAPPAAPAPTSLPSVRISVGPAPAAAVSHQETVTTRASAQPASLPAFEPGTIMADAQKLVDAGDLLAAREKLNPAIISGTLPPAQQRAAMQLQAQINHTLVFSGRRVAGDPWVESYLVKPGDMLQKICPPYNTTARFTLRINGIPDARRLRANSTIKLVKGPFHAVVTKSAFVMDLYLGAPGGEGSLYVCSFPVGLGQDDSTPAGKWLVEPNRKLIKPKYFDPRGGTTIEAGDPTNPLGDYWIGLVGTDGEAVGRLSYGIHGTIEPDSIGKMASMGCIRMHNEDVAVVYEMLIEGKSIVIVNP